MRTVKEIIGTITNDTIEAVKSGEVVVVDWGSNEVISMIENEMSNEEIEEYGVEEVAKEYENEAVAIAETKDWEVLGYRDNGGVRISK